MKRVVYTGPQAGGVDVPEYGIVGWRPGEVREVPDELADELLQRGEFSGASLSWMGQENTEEGF